MKKFAILADVTCDLGKELRAQYDVEFVNGHFTTPDGKEHASYLEWTDTTPSQFYKELRAKPNDYTTAPPNVAEWCAAMEEYVKQDMGVLALTISSALSGTYDFLCQAAAQIKEKYPQAEIRTIDSRRFSSGHGLLCVYASILREEGKTLDETADWVESNLNRFHQAGWLDDLSFVAKKGRLTAAKAFFGSLMGLKPIGEFDQNGLTTVIGKAKGEKQAYPVLLKYIENTIENPEEQIIFIATADRLSQAEHYKELLEEKFHPKAIYINYVYPSSGINVGPGLMAAYYMGKPISEGLTEERQLITELLAKK
ncbi:MAG: DegV family protein [Clostridia bacterium]|nr:DegV family protein [Clostridia bacterium]